LLKVKYYFKKFFRVQRLMTLDCTLFSLLINFDYMIRNPVELRDEEFELFLDDFLEICKHENLGIIFFRCDLLRRFNV